MPDWKRYVREHLPPLALDAERELEIVEELATHLEAAYEAALAEGVSAREAERRVASQVADWRLLECELLRVESSATESWLLKAEQIQPQKEWKGRSMLEALIQDLHFGFRMLRKKPGFTVVAVVTLAAGIGLNAAIFSVVNAVLLRPLTYREPDRLVQIWEANWKKGVDDNVVSPTNFLDWQSRSQSFEKMAIYNSWLPALGVGDGTAKIAGATVSGISFSCWALRRSWGAPSAWKKRNPARTAWSSSVTVSGSNALAVMPR